MNILHVISTMDPRAGGTCQGVRNISRPLLAHGHEVEVVCLDDPQAEYLKRETLSVHALGRGRWGWSYHPALRPWLDANVKRFEAIVLNGLWQYPGHALAQIAGKGGKPMPPYFVYPHGMLDPWFQQTPERRLKAIRNWFYWKWSERHVIARAKAICFTCREEMRLAQDTFRPYQPQTQVNVGFGIDQPPTFRPAMVTALAERCPGLSGQPYWLYLSRIHPKKGLDLLIKAYAQLYNSSSIANHSELPRLVIAGPELETDYGTQMQKLAADLCPSAAVFWPGMLTGDAKWGAVYGCEAFVLPSHQENFGIAVAEAMACGRAVLISDKVNIWREIQGDGAGLVECDDLPGTVKLLTRWLAMAKEERVTMGRATRVSFAERFDVTRAAETLIETIQAGIAEHSPERKASWG